MNRALLVGINAYAGQPLRGCVNDVQDMAELLVARCRFRRDEVRLLCDARATRTAVIERLAWLLHGVRAGDRVLFHFSGHGVQLPTRNAAGEIDGLDEALCPADFAWTPETALREGDFAQLFALVPPGVNVTWIDDTCHAAESTREPPTHWTRLLRPPADLAWRLKAAQTAVRARSRGMRVTRLADALHSPRVALLAACAASEGAVEADFEGRAGGAFTHALVKELEKSNALECSLVELMKRVSSTIATRFGQRPQLAGRGPALHAPFLAALARVSEAPLVTEEDEDPGRRILVNVRAVMAKDTQGARGRRFAEGLQADAAALNASIGFDWRLLPHDIAGSIAHARMLARQGIIPVADADKIIAGLREVEKAIKAGEIELDASLEDIHMNVEARLTERIGEAGGRLHTARSRNDQVATDLKLYTMASCGRLIGEIDALRAALVEQAAKHVDTLAPGYTHLQRAQPVRLAHHLLAYVAMLGRDRGRVLDAAKRCDESPLGSGALAATTHPIDREGVAKDLQLGGITRNSLDAVGDRDFAVEVVAACALTQAHLSRLGEELVLWAAQEFRFVKLPEGYCSGSSLMPQKVNPDIPELVRAKTGRVYGDLMALLTVIKGLPLAYNKDLQETQEPLYDAVETTGASLHVMTGLVRGLEFDTERLARAVGEGYLVATELADYLVTKGVPFRRAHDVAGLLVRKAIAKGVELAALSLDELKAEAPEFEADVAGWLDPMRAIDRRDVPGGPARVRIEAEIVRLKKELGA